MMTKEEKKDWCDHVCALQKTYNEYYSADMSFRSATHGKRRYEKEKERLVMNLKHQLKWPPFKDYANILSPFAFDECFDSLDTYMERAITTIINRELKS